MCKAGGKFFKDWYRLDSTKELIKEISSDGGLCPCKIPVETSKSKHIGSWIHPDLAVQLAQWISPSFAIQVSRWIRELYLTGSVSLDSRKSDEELKRLQDQLEQQALELKQKEALVKETSEKLKEKDEHINRLNTIHKELVSYKKSVLKEETIYIVSTADYARQGIYKVGRTKRSMRFRSSVHNTCHINGDKVRVLCTFKVGDSLAVERNIHSKLRGLLLQGEKEFFLCPYDLLESVVDMIVHDDDEQTDMVNRIIDSVYRLKEKAFTVTDWMCGLPKGVFNERLALVDEDNNKLMEFNVTNWSVEHKQSFVSSCLKQYITQRYNMEELDDNQYQLMWKTFQAFMVSQLSIPKHQFKASEWKPIVKEYVDKEKSLTIKWRS
jgi:hypothetical protein